MLPSVMCHIGSVTGNTARTGRHRHHRSCSSALLFESVVGTLHFCIFLQRPHLEKAKYETSSVPASDSNRQADDIDTEQLTRLQCSPSPIPTSRFFCESVDRILYRKMFYLASVMLQCSADLPEGGPPLCVQGRQRSFERRAVPLWYDHNNSLEVGTIIFSALCRPMIVNRTKSALGSRLLR